MPSDPFESYLKRAADLFEAGDIVQAGQIWQAILKKRPDHEVARAGLYKVKLYFDARATQGGLVKQKPAVAADDVRATHGASSKSQDPEITRLLEQGCTLYDAGHVEDALTKWVQVLAKEPDNVLAKGYINGARRTLGQPLLAEAVMPVPAPEAVPPSVPAAVAEPEVDIERLLRDGCTLFDMGQLEDALKKWEQILAHDPGHALARAYVQDARKDLGLPPLAEGDRPAVVLQAEPDRAQPEPQAEAQDERLENMVRDGVQLYDMGMIQEAIQKWQQVLAVAPGHRDAEGYLAMAKRDAETSVPAARPVASRPPEPPAGGIHGYQKAYAPVAALELALEEPVEEAAPVTEAPVTPPAALTSGAQKPRKGLNLPDQLQKISLPSWMASPAFILGTISGLVILVIGSFYFLRHRKDKALEQAVAAFRASAVSPVSRNAEIANLQQTPEEIQQEARSALGDDPLIAYLRAKEVLRLNPGDAEAAQLLERAKADLAKEGAASVTIADFEKQLHDGDLESADRSMAVLLSQNPDDQALQERASRLYGSLIPAYASKEMWSEAEAHLRRCRAMFPTDKSWSVKLRLLARIQSLPRGERASWIQLLG